MRPVRFLTYPPGTYTSSSRWANLASFLGCAERAHAKPLETCLTPTLSVFVR